DEWFGCDGRFPGAVGGGVGRLGRHGSVAFNRLRKRRGPARGDANSPGHGWTAPLCRLGMGRPTHRTSRLPHYRDTALPRGVMTTPRARYPNGAAPGAGGAARRAPASTDRRPAHAPAGFQEIYFRPPSLPLGPARRYARARFSLRATRPAQ